MGIRINMGCGMTLTEGWVNIDKSLSWSLARLYHPIIKLFYRLGLLDTGQYQYICFAKKNGIIAPDATKRRPFEDGLVDVIYSSHMLEHLDRAQAQLFLAEAYRVLAPGGFLRIAVPDLSLVIDRYREHGDADLFIESLGVCESKPKTFKQQFNFLLTGSRHHHWMYDGNSLCKLLTSSKFREAEV